jgi:RNA polymerase sigma-70 factor (ECF subfamily)
LLIEFAAARTANYEDAEDAVQEAFLLAYRHLHSFNERYSLKNWLFTITYRQLVSSYRKKKPARLSEEVTSGLAATQASSTPHEWLWDAARMMGTDMFTALWLKYKQEMPIAEIAAIMKKSQTAVRVLLHRARKRLAREIAECPSETAEQLNWNFRRSACLERTK